MNWAVFLPARNHPSTRPGPTDWADAVMRTMLRRAAAGLAAGLVACVSLLAGATVASAAPKAITSQWYVKPTHLDQLKKAGWDGSGVTIAIIDGPPDLSVPELAGVDVTVIDACHGAKASLDDVAHGTAVLSILANKTWGWAPKAKYLFYAKHTAGSEGLCDGDAPTMMRAMNDGADIISMSLVTPFLSADRWVNARAIVKGVPLVFGAGNEGRECDIKGAEFAAVLPPSDANGAVSVGANDVDGRRADFSSWGKGLTIMAPGTQVNMRYPDSSGKLTRIATGQGTSFSTPMVAGALALAMQKWPDANGNQLIASMIDNAKRSADGWTPQAGWGNFSPLSLIDKDPSGYSTDSPLLDKETPNPALAKLDPDGSGVTVEQKHVDDYRDGLADPDPIVVQLGDKEYVYRGTDPKYVDMQYVPKSQMSPGTSPRFATASPTPAVSASPSPTASSSPVAVTPPDGSSPGVPWPAVAVGAGVVVVVAVVIAVVAVRRRRAVPVGRRVSDG